MASVTIRGLTKRFGDSVAIDHLDLDIKEGEFLTLLGPSGCGKTTTLRCIAGLERPTSGEVQIGDRLVVGENTFIPPNRRHLGMVFQSYALWPNMTVASNVGYPLRVGRGTGRAEARKRINEALDRVGLAHLGNRAIGALSGGQQQRVALARAIVAQPPLLLFDEPLSNLDAKLRATMRTELQELHDRLGMTSVYVTHDRIEALTLSDRIVVMNKGRVRQIGTPEEIYSTPADKFVADFIGFENFIPGVVTDQSSAQDTIDVLGSGKLMSPSNKELKVGDEVAVAVRSSALTLAPTKDAVGNSLPVRMRTRTYYGDHNEYLVELAGHTVRVQMSLEDSARLPEGDDELSLLLPTSGLNVFKDH